MHYLDKIGASSCSKDQKEVILSSTELPFLFLLSHQLNYSHLDYYGHSRSNSTNYFNVNTSHSTLQLGFSDGIRILNALINYSEKFIFNKLLNIKDNSTLVLPDDVLNTIKRNLITEQKNKNNINKLIPGVEYKIFFSKEVNVLRVSFKEFCKNNDISYKIVRDVSRANLVVGNYSKQHDILASNFTEPFKLVNINNTVFKIFNYEINRVFGPENNKHTLTIKSNNLEKIFVEKDGDIFYSDQISNIVNNSLDPNSEYVKLFSFVNSIGQNKLSECFTELEKTIYSLVSLVSSQAGFHNTSTVSQHIFNIFEQYQNRISKGNKVTFISEDDLQKQLVNSFETIITNENLLLACNLIENDHSFQLGMKMATNINLKESGINSWLLLSFIEVSSKQYELSKYRNKVEYKTFINQYEKHVGDLINAYKKKYTEKEIVDRFESFNSFNGMSNFNHPYGTISNSLIHFIHVHQSNFPAFMLALDVFGIGTEELYNKIILEIRNRFDDNRPAHLYMIPNGSGSNSIDLKEFYKILIKCQTEIEQQETTGNEVVSIP